MAMRSAAPLHMPAASPNSTDTISQPASGRQACSVGYMPMMYCWGRLVTSVQSAVVKSQLSPAQQAQRASGTVTTVTIELGTLPNRLNLAHPIHPVSERGGASDSVCPVAVAKGPYPPVNWMWRL